MPVAQRSSAVFNKALRPVTAILGSYAATAMLSALMARLLPGAAVDATAWALNLSFALYAGLLLWVFVSQRLIRTALIIWGAALIGAGLLRFLGHHA